MNPTTNLPSNKFTSSFIPPPDTNKEAVVADAKRAEEDRKILLYTKFKPIREMLSLNRHGKFKKFSLQEKQTFYQDYDEGKILAKKRAYAEKIIQVEPRIWPQGTWEGGTQGATREQLLRDFFELNPARDMNMLIGDIDEKLVARMNDANADREEMKASINLIQEKMTDHGWF